jgi:hypothetical protein
MTDRKLFGLFSGAQITLLLCAAILTPGAVYATAALTAVAITEPGSGKQSYIDGSRRLYTYDPIAGYANNPANIVNIAYSSTSCGNMYTVPTGKALIIKSATINYYLGTSGTDNYVYLETPIQQIVGFDSAGAVDERNFSLGSGVIVHSNIVISCVKSNSYSIISIQGYLVPSGAVPALGTQEAAEQLVTVGQPLRK